MKGNYLLGLFLLFPVLLIIILPSAPKSYGDISLYVNQTDSVTVRISLENPESEPKPFVYILQILDRSGATEFIAWKSGALVIEETVEIGWNPTKKGTYTLQSFIWSGFENPVPLPTLLQETDISVNGNQIVRCSGNANCFTATVTKIIDGDTIAVDRNISIRLALVDSPEVDEEGYVKATNFTQEMCPLDSIVLIDEDDGQIEGSLGRMIAKVYCGDGKVINEELVTAGHAVLDTRFCDESEFASEEWAQEYGCKDVQNPELGTEEETSQMSIGELKQYAQSKINEDRAKYGLPPVSLSNNLAAQAHADDLFKTRFHSSHWTSDGMKPYMKYTVYGGEGAVFQNIHAGQIYFDEDIERCESGQFICEKIDMKKQIQESEYGMMYEDADSDWGHRDNILDKYHTHVSIGIAYDDYYFAFVQNFENIYLELDNKIEKNRGYIEMSGTFLEGNLYGIVVYYDELPTVDVYERYKEQEWYDYGEFVAAVVEPARAGYYYEQPPDYTLIEAKRWQLEEDEFDLAFNLSQLMNEKDGVYTIVILLEDENHDIFEGASHSFFEQ